MAQFQEADGGRLFAAVAVGGRISQVAVEQGHRRGQVLAASAQRPRVGACGNCPGLGLTLVAVAAQDCNRFGDTALG